MDTFRNVEVVEKKAIAKGITSFRVAGDGSMADAPPGAHIDVKLPSGTVRQYSLTQADVAAPAHYEFAVLREKYGRGGSIELVDNVKPGDQLEITDPRSNFELEDSYDRYLLLGGGVGVTPLLGMARELSRRNSQFTFHICAKTAGHVAFKKDLDDAYPDQMRYAFSQDSGSYRLHLPSLLSAVSGDTQVYACGPERFLTEIESVAADWPAGRLRVEHFTNEVEELPDELSGDFTVELKKTGKTIVVPANKSILEALAEMGMQVPSSCEEGVCGTCITKVFEGEIIHRDACLYDEEKEANSAIACCVSRGHPGTTIVLDL